MEIRESSRWRVSDNPLGAHFNAIGFRLSEHGFRAFSGCLFRARSRGNLVRAYT
jgi:hypothetical protein